MSDTTATLPDAAPVAGGAPVFDVPWLNAFGSRLLARHRGAFVSLARLETRSLSATAANVDTSSPIFVCGLARSGTTVLLELLARHGQTASQRYLDYPFVFTPYWWNRYLEFARRGSCECAERAHRDGLMVSAESPEAMEEPLWMHFFPAAHDPSVCNVLSGDAENADFEAFYRSHMAKLLAVRGRTRYLAKGNYHVARMGYLGRVFPDARFVIPVRDPVMHIASSMKQHALFARGQEQNADARLYLAQIGHFEFGLDRAPINVDAGKTAEVLKLWNAGDEVGGWAHYWAAIHDYIAGALDASPALRRQVMLVEYEQLCAKPDAYARRLLGHCGLAEDRDCRAWAQRNISARSYYKPEFPPAETARIKDITAPALSRLRTHFAAV